MSIEAEKTFVGTSPPDFRLAKKDILWLVLVWCGFIVWSVIDDSFFPIIVVGFFTILSVVIRLPALVGKTYIKIGNGALSVHSKDALLWKTPLQDITSIELEESERIMSATPGRALLIRNNKDDSYYLPLDGTSFEGYEPAELVNALNEIRNSA